MTPEILREVLQEVILCLMIPKPGMDMLAKEDLVKLANWRMPFGKYQGRCLIDLPEEYLLWFAKKGFPSGELGMLLQLCLELKIEGLDAMIRPLKQSQPGQS